MRALVLLAALLAGCTGSPRPEVDAGDAGDGGAADAAPRPVSVRMLVGGAHHDYDALPPELAANLEARGDVRIEIVRDVAAIGAAALGGVDVLFVHTCLPDVAPDAALEGEIARGLGLVAMHCALASFRGAPWWTPLVGGFAPGHEPYGTFSVTLEAAHPALLGVAPAFELTDEPYWIDDRAADAQVLVRSSRILLGPDGGPRDGREPLVWTRSVGRGRVFSSAFGHDGAAQRSPEVLRLLHGGILWAAGRR